MVVGSLQRLDLTVQGKKGEQRSRGRGMGIKT